MRGLVANREWVEETLEQLLSPECRESILFFHGESGIGKSVLLKLFSGKLPPEIPRVNYCFENSICGLAEVFFQSGFELGWEKFSNFIKELNALRESSQFGVSFSDPYKPSSVKTLGSEQLVKLKDILLDRFDKSEIQLLCFDLDVNFGDLSEKRNLAIVELIGHLTRRNRILALVDYIQKARPDIQLDTLVADIKPEPLMKKNLLSSIQTALNPEDHFSRMYFQDRLTKAWSLDLAAFDSIVFLTFDTLEQASDEIKEWLNEPFLESIAQANNLRILLAGQQVLPIRAITCERYWKSYELQGIPDIEYWLPIIEKMNRRVEGGDPKSFLECLCASFEGRPEEIMKAIEGLPSKKI